MALLYTEALHNNNLMGGGRGRRTMDSTMYVKKHGHLFVTFTPYVFCQYRLFFISFSPSISRGSNEGERMMELQKKKVVRAENW